MRTREYGKSLYNHLLGAYMDTDSVCLTPRETEKVFEFIRAACHYIEILDNAGNKPTSHEQRILEEYLPMLMKMKQELEEKR